MTQASAQASTGPYSCEEDAELANSLVLKPLKIRHYQLTKGVWMSGHGALKEDESTDEGVVHQITVIHEDGFLRTYTVSEAEFELIEEDQDLEAIQPEERRAQCLIDKEGEKVTKKMIEEKMNSRKFKGGCEEGRKMMAEKAELKEMAGTRIQFWDPTQADWFAGQILGMWSDKPKTHFLCGFDDETEYALDPLKDAWQLDPEAPVLPLDQYKSKGFGRFVQTSDGKSEILEFIVLTKAPRQRLHVCCSKYCIRVYKSAKADGAGAADDADTSDDESEMVSDEANRENHPSAEQVASEGDGNRKKQSRSKCWSAFSDQALNIGEISTEVILNEAEKPVALKVRVPVQTGDQEGGAKKAAPKKRGRRPKAVQ